MTTTDRSDQPLPKLLNLHQVAAVIGIRRDTLRSWVAEGQGPRPYRYDRRAGRAPVWTQRELNAWRDQRKHGQA